MTTLSDRHCQPKVTRLAREPALALLSHLPGWTIEGDTLVRTYSFPDFHETMAFVNLVAFIAHREDHHPELVVSFNRCRVTYNTHSVGGLSENDFICAARIDQASGA